MKDISELTEMFNLKFNNPDLLTTALVHRSYINEHPTFNLPHNERLEFLGDAVLELIVTEYLYLKYKNPEGELTNWRASLVNAKILSQVASEIGLDEFLFLSKGESKDSGTKARQYILANAIEAVIGAIYLDQGWDKTKEFIAANVLTRLDHILKNKLYLDAKSRFQESAQEKHGVTPSYKVHSEAGPDHNKNFVIGVYLGKELVAEGAGTSKQEAQTAAAEAGLKTKGW